MSDHLKEKEYRDRLRYWTVHALNTLNFSINFFLGLTVLLVGFFTQKSNQFHGIRIDFCNTDLWLTIKVFSFLSLMLSLLSGGAAVLFRLFDARVTRHIISTRYKYTKDNSKNGSEVYLKGSSKDKKNLGETLVFIWNYEKNQIHLSELTDGNKMIVESKLKELRSVSSSAGKLAWKFHHWQIGIFILGTLLYIISILST